MDTTKVHEARLLTLIVVRQKTVGSCRGINCHVLSCMISGIRQLELKVHDSMLNSC